MNVQNATIYNQVIMTIHDDIALSKINLDMIKCYDFLGIHIDTILLENFIIAINNFEELIDMIYITAYNDSTIGLIMIASYQMVPTIK